MKNENKKRGNLWLPIGAILLVCFVLLAWLCGAWLDLEIASQLFAAIAGAIIAAIITMLLLKGQSDSEEQKDKSIKIYENKIQVYSHFLSLMWKTLDDEELSKDEFISIRSKIFETLIFYIDDSYIDDLRKAFSEINLENGGVETPKTFCKITRILKNDLNGFKNDEKNMQEDKIESLWSSLGSVLNNFSDDEEDENRIDENTVQGVIKRNTKILNIYDWEKQLKVFKDGVWEIGLFEYGETWRTNQVKRVQKDDLVFLFLRGGIGFVGIFRVKGWRVFIINNGIWKEHICDKEGGKGVETIENEEHIRIDKENYDMYNVVYTEGATSVANIIVEPLVFNEKGVGNPASAYRKTISGYDANYAWLVTSRFLAIKDDIDPEWLKKCNIRLFEELCRENNVIAAIDKEKWYNR